MQDNFYLIYDVAVAAVLIGMLFAGAKRGFASAVVSFLAVVAAFIAAGAVSGPLSAQVYESYIKQPLESAVDEQLDDMMSSITLGGLSGLDYEKVLISGVPADEVKLNYAGTRKALIELTDLDLSGTGIAEVDLSVFGITSSTDFSSVNAKTADFKMSDVEKYGLGKLAVAQYIAVNAVNTDFAESFGEYIGSMTELLPMLSGTGDVFSESGTAAVRALVLSMTDGAATVKAAIFDSIIEPYFILALKSISFLVIFIVVTVVLGIIANALKVVNKIPLIGDLNAFLGGAAGLVQGAFTLVIICAAIRMVITISGGNVDFLNETEIAKTYVFKYIYNLDFLNLLN